MVSKKRLNVHVYVTPICNLRCKHCYYVARSPGSSPDSLMSICEIGQVIVALSDSYAPAFDVEGGEFFLRDDIAELFEVVPSRCWSNVTITTNGTVGIDVSPDHLSGLDEFRVSVEGHTDALQQDLRGVRLQPVLTTCLSLLSTGVPVTLRITLHKKNYEYLIEMVDFFTDMGFTRFSFYEFQAVGRGRIYKDEYCLERAEIREVLNLLCSVPAVSKPEMLKLSLNARRVPLVNSVHDKLTSHGHEIIDLSGVPSLTVDYDGTLGVCPWNVRSRTIGVFRKESFIADVAEYLRTGQLDHDCDHCSTIRVRYQD